MSTDPVRARSRVTLRRYTAGDADWYARTSRDPAIQQFTSEPPDLTADDVAVAITESNCDPAREAFLIVGDGDMDRLGNLAIHIRGAEAELSYWVSPEGRGRGVARQAILLACEWLHTHTSVETVGLWTLDGNVASRRAAEQAGFEFAGRSRRRLRGHLVDSDEFARPISVARTAARHDAFGSESRPEDSPDGAV